MGFDLISYQSKVVFPSLYIPNTDSNFGICVYLSSFDKVQHGLVNIVTG